MVVQTPQITENHHVYYREQQINTDSVTHERRIMSAAFEEYNDKYKKPNAR